MFAEFKRVSILLVVTPMFSSATWRPVVLFPRSL